MLGAVVQANGERLLPGENGFAEDQIEIRGFLDATLATVAKTIDDVAFALTDSVHVDADVFRVDAVVGPRRTR